MADLQTILQEQINKRYDDELRNYFNAHVNIDLSESPELVRLIVEDPLYLWIHFKRITGYTCQEFLRLRNRGTNYLNKIFRLLQFANIADDFVRVCSEESYPVMQDNSVACKNDECPICFESLLNDRVLQCPQCKHCFHSHCVSPICNGNRHCPMCRLEWPAGCRNMKRTDSYKKPRTLRSRGGKSRRKKISIVYERI